MRVVTPDALRRRLSDLPQLMPRVVASGNHAVPWTLLQVADDALATYRLLMLNAPVGIPDRDGVVLESAFVGAGMRGKPALAYLPSRLSLVPALLRRQAFPDVVLLNTTTPRGGLVSLGCEVNVLPAAIESARGRGGLVVAALNPRMPYTYGDAQLPIDEIDLAVEVDEPLGILPRREPGDVHREIGDRVAALIPDGATLQTGIGMIPDAVLGSLTSRRDLRVWTEMFSDGMLALAKAGALAEASITTSFAAGTEELYDFLDGNRDVVFLRTERTNDPSMISRQPHMASINAALQVDLYAQANASYVRSRIYSGFGGQSDFVVGALHADGGQAIIALPSWHDASDSSTIIPRLHDPATSFQHSYIVTEQGVAAIWGWSQREQARNLIDHAAAPAARGELREAATALGLL